MNLCCNFRTVISNNIISIYIKFTEDKNLISINDLKLNNKNELVSVSAIEVRTFNNNEENNNFKISFNKKISVVPKLSHM